MEKLFLLDLMTDYRTRLAKSLVLQLDKLAVALHKQANAVRANTRAVEEAARQKNEQLPLASPLPVDLSKAATAIVKGETKIHVKNSWDWREYLRLAAEVIGLAVLVWYASTTHGLWSESQRQTAIAEQQSRPWLKVIEVNLNSPETLTFNNGRMMIGPRETLMLFGTRVKDPVASADIRAEFRLKNIGKSVAQNIEVIAELFFAPAGSADSIQKEQDRFCAQEGPTDHGPLSSRSALFPDDEFPKDIHAVGFVPKDGVSRREGVDWVSPVLIGCVTYQRPRDFQTRVAYAIAGLTSHDIVLGKVLGREQIRFIRDEHYEYAR